MPRQARTISATNVYHAIFRGVNKQYLFSSHEEGIVPRTLSRLTGVPYSIVQRATSDTIRYGSMVCESLHGDEDYQTYIDDSEYEKYPEYKHLLRFRCTCGPVSVTLLVRLMKPVSVRL